MKKGMTIVAVSLVAALSNLAAAQAVDHSAHAAVTAATSTATTEGEVRKVDKEAKKVTLRHGPIQNLDMPPMTMVFQVQDPTLLDRVKAGDKVKFAADKIGGAITVTSIEVVN